MDLKKGVGRDMHNWWNYQNNRDEKVDSMTYMAQVSSSITRVMSRD